MPWVLVVDDSAAVRRMVQLMLEEARFQVVCAASGEEAFERVLSEPFEVIITDVTMEDLSGMQLCRILNDDPATSAIPVVMLTATDTPYSRFCARHAGADGYVTKAQARETLVPTVEALVDRAGPRRALPTEMQGSRDPVKRLSQVLEEQLFLTLVSSEIRGFARHIEEREELTTGVVRLCGEVLGHAYAVLELIGPAGRSLTVHTRGPWPEQMHEGFEALGVEVAPGDAVARIAHERGATGPVQVGAAERFAIEAAGEVLGSLSIFGGPGGLAERTRILARHIAAELSLVARSLVLVEQMRRMAETDPLTGLANRRRCVERLEHELARSQRSGSALCLMICDVDHFKAVNDTHGHNAGDDVLRAVARELEARVRTVDLVGRWGGEEFVLVLPDAPLEGGRLVAERLRRAVEALTFEGPVEGITISAGVVECDPKLPIDTLVQRADECLYGAKDGGRNRVVVCAADGTRR